MQVHVLIECWGTSTDEMSVTPYRNRKKAEKEFARVIEEHLDGSDLDSEPVIKLAQKHDFLFEHSDGFITLETTKLC